MDVDAGLVASVPTGALRAASDQRLVEQVRAGSHPAFDTLFHRHHPGVLAFCAQMLASQVEGEDAAQQTFLVAYRDLVRAAQPAELRPWLYGIARHRCLMALRARRERPVGVVSDPGRSSDLTAEVGVRADVRALLADVARLPAAQRDALVLAELGGLSHDAIARVLGCPRTKIKALVFQARASLKAAREARETPCAEIREQLTTLRGPALMRATLRRHLTDCAGCRAYREAQRGRRRGFGARPPWGLAIALKRCVVGVAAGPGTGTLTAGALGEAGLTALVVVTITASGGAPAAPPSRERGEPVGPIVHAAPVSSVARRMDTRPSVDRVRSPDVPGAEPGGGGSPVEPARDPGETSSDAAETSSDPGEIGAAERPAPDNTAFEDDRSPSDEPGAEIGEPFTPYEEGPSQPQASGGVRDSGGVRSPAPTLPRTDAGPARQPAPQTPVSSSASPDQPAPQHRRPQSPLRAETDHSQPPSPLRPASEQRQPSPPSRPASEQRQPSAPPRPANEHRQPSLPSRPTNEYGRAPSSPGLAEHQAQPTRAQPDARLADPQRPLPEAQPAGGHQVRPASTAPSGDSRGQPTGAPASKTRQRDQSSVAARGGGPR